MLAPKIIGIDIKKENLTASFSFNPKSNPEEIVAPLLEIPGNIARACDKPINKEFL